MFYFLIYYSLTLIENSFSIWWNILFTNFNTVAYNYFTWQPRIKERENERIGERWGNFGRIGERKGELLCREICQNLSCQPLGERYSALYRRPNWYREHYRPKNYRNTIGNFQLGFHKSIRSALLKLYFSWLTLSFPLIVVYHYSIE